MEANEQVKKIVKGQEEAITKIGVIKFTRAMVGLYNSLCIYCRLRLQRNPKMSIDHYCPKCKPIAEETIQRLLK